MKSTLNLGAGRLVLALTALAAIGFAVLAPSGKTATSNAPQAVVPVCAVCDARHARLVQMRAAVLGETE
jgi:hypothetical protein